jgi:hypothetical protein
MWRTRTYPVKVLAVVKVTVQKTRLSWSNPERAVAMILGPAGRHYMTASILRLAGFGGSGVRIEI